ncbi:MAG: hypothetical protein ACRDGM_00820 [bacterium]
MIVDWLIYGVLVFASVKVLNSTVFRTKPASQLAAWTLTAVVFVLSVVVLSTLKALRFRSMSEGLGFPLTLRNPLDVGGGFVFAWLFFSFLRRTRNAKQSPPAGGDAP